MNRLRQIASDRDKAALSDGSEAPAALPQAEEQSVA
jgi:hypothetical protein